MDVNLGLLVTDERINMLVSLVTISAYLVVSYRKLYTKPILLLSRKIRRRGVITGFFGRIVRSHKFLNTLWTHLMSLQYPLITVACSL